MLKTAEDAVRFGPALAGVLSPSPRQRGTFPSTLPKGWERPAAMGLTDPELVPQGRAEGSIRARSIRDAGVRHLCRIPSIVEGPSRARRRSHPTSRTCLTCPTRRTSLQGTGQVNLAIIPILPILTNAFYLLPPIHKVLIEYFAYINWQGHRKGCRCKCS